MEEFQKNFWSQIKKTLYIDFSIYI